MKLIIYGINFSPELTGVGKYTGEMVSYLSNNDVEIVVITAPPYYPNWRILKGYTACYYKREYNNKKSLEVIRCPLFIPKQPNALLRLVHLLSFSITSAFALLSKLFFRPNMIIVVEPTLFCAPIALFYSALTGAKSILHIQDYEIEAIFGLALLKNRILYRLSYSVEKMLIKHFDYISSISDRMLKKAIKKGATLNKTIFLPNWVDTKFFNPTVSGDRFRRKWGFSINHRIVLYSGNIGKKQGLDIIIKAAEYYTKNNTVQFLIVGQGVCRQELEKLTKKVKLINVHFKNLVSYLELPELLAMADIHLIVQKKGVADAVLPSKLSSILSVGGHVVITAEKQTELGCLIEGHPGIAKRVEPENLDELIKGIQYLLGKDTKTPNILARRFATEYLEKNIILSRFYQDLYNLC